MPLPVKRIFDEKRRVILPLVGVLALNIAAYAAIIYPMSLRARGAEQRAAAAAASLQAAEREHAAAAAAAAGRAKTDAALKVFYTDVLPKSFAEARESTFLRLTQLAAQHDLIQSRRSTTIEEDKQLSLARMRINVSLEGSYEDIRRFIHQVEAGHDFLVLDSVSLRQGIEPGSALTLDIVLSTYYRRGADGA